jgi:hypothetical protein
LLQCYYRMKQIERETKGEEADATDDEVSYISAFDVASLTFLGKCASAYLHR